MGPAVAAFETGTHPVADQSRRSGANRSTFDPERVARLETMAWRAYYDRRWSALLYFTERACADQFHVPFPDSVRAAYYATRGALAFKPIENNIGLAVGALVRYYAIVRRHSNITFDPVEVARAEIRYWVVHRRLSGSGDHEELVDTFARLHAVTFDLAPARARESAEFRTRAAIVVDDITARRSVDVDGDWGRVELLLRRCYRSLAAAIA